MSAIGRRFVFVWLAALCVLFAFGCGKPSAEELQKQWNKNQEDLFKAGAKFPNFKAAIDDLLGSAGKEFEDAKGGEEKTRADRMKAAIERVAALSRSFGDYDGEAAKLDKYMKDKDLLSLPAGTFNPVNDDAKQALAQAEGKLKDARPLSGDEARQAVIEATTLLRNAVAKFEALKRSTLGPSGTARSTGTGTGAATGTGNATMPKY